MGSKIFVSDELISCISILFLSKNILFLTTPTFNISNVLRSAVCCVVRCYKLHFYFKKSYLSQKNCWRQQSKLLFRLSWFPSSKYFFIFVM